MATVNPTRTRTRAAARKRNIEPCEAAPVLVGDSLPTGDISTRPLQKTPVRPMLAHYAPHGVLSLRHQMAAHECAVIDAALSILENHMRKPGVLCNSPEPVEQYLRLALAGEQRELFAAVYLDTQLRAIAFETLFFGTLSQASVYPREVVRSALGHNAANVVIAHNHPSGNATPSLQDLTLTQTLKGALALVDVRLVDHVIVTFDNATSLARRGLL